MGYILDLRKIVGHRPLIQVGASTIIENNEGQILLQLRKDNNCWGYHGGSLEVNEVVEEAAKRELLEETGLTAEEMELFGVFSGEKMSYTYPNGDVVSNVDIVFICKKYHGTIRPQESEVKELKFFSAHELPDNISPPNRLPIEKWKSNKICSRYI